MQEFLSVAVWYYVHLKIVFLVCNSFLETGLQNNSSRQKRKWLIQSSIQGICGNVLGKIVFLWKKDLGHKIS